MLQYFRGVTIGKGSDGDIPIIEDGVCIMTNAVIVGGVTIGNNSIIGAYSFVCKSVVPNSVVGGVQAKVLYYKTNSEKERGK